MNLNQVTVYSKDVGKAVEFYKKLGLLLIVDSVPHYARFECPNGDSTFSSRFFIFTPQFHEPVKGLLNVRNHRARVDRWLLH